jgi:hypothetical protein
MSVPDREADENRIFRALTVVVCDLQAKCPHTLYEKSANLLERTYHAGENTRTYS